MTNPEKLIEKANKKLNPGFFGKLLSDEEGRKEEAAELYEQAANLYKLKKNWSEAGKCYEKAGELEEQSNGTAAYTQYQEAAHCYGFVDQNKKKQAINKCIKSCENVGKFMQAGKLLQQMATECEENLDYENAIELYQKAHDYFKSESQNTKSLQQSCLTKVADLMCLSDHKDMFTEAPRIYEKLGMQYLTNPLLKSSAKNMFFKCVVVYLAKKDEISADNSLKKFLIEDPTFDDTRDSKFLKETITYVTEPCNPEGFKTAVNSYKKVNNLDKWMLTMFGKILKAIEVDEEDMK